MPDQGIISDCSVKEVDNDSPDNPATITIAYTTHFKKRTFIDNLRKFAKTWRGRLQPRGQCVRVNLIPLFDEDGVTLTSAVRHLPVHAILHKRTDDMAAVLAHEDQDARYRLSVLEDILQYGVPFSVPEDRTIHRRLPAAPIDPLSGIWRLVDRAEILTVIDKAFRDAEHADRNDKGIIDENGLAQRQDQQVRTLPWTMLSTLETSTKNIEKILEAKGVQFPVILKPRLACGDPVSHCMVVASNSVQIANALERVFRISEGSSRFGECVAAQQFVPRHDNVLFKLYALGTHVLVQSRLSIGFADKGNDNTKGASSDERKQDRRGKPDCDEDREFFYFDSQALSNKNVVEFSEKTGQGIGTDVVKPSNKLAKKIILKLRRELDGLSLLGADVVYDVDEKTYYIVDVNYFPGYKHFPEALSYLLQSVVDQVVERDILNREEDCTLSTHLTNLDGLYQCQPFLQDDANTSPNLMDYTEDDPYNGDLEAPKPFVPWKLEGCDDNGSIGESLVTMAVWNTEDNCLESGVDVIGRGGCING